jgi:DNA-binding NtrC family response regulator
MPVVVLVGSSDRALEELLRQSAAVTVRAVADMSALAALPRDPDAVVLDLRRGPEIPPEIAAYKRQHAGVPVVIVARSLDPDLLLAAMRAGVSEVVAEPVTLEQLTAALARVSGTKASTEAGQVFAYVGA